MAIECMEERNVKYLCRLKPNACVSTLYALTADQRQTSPFNL